MFRHDVVRNIVSLRLLLVVVLSFGLMFVQYWTTHHAGFAVLDSSSTFLREVMLFSPYGSGSGLYMLLLPFLAAVLGGSVMASERHSGRLKGILAREGRGRVLRTSMASGFVLGGIGGTLPLLLNLITAAAFNPHLSFIDGNNVTADGGLLRRYVLIDATSWGYPIYERSQLLLILVVLLMVFVLSGLFSCVAVGASFFTTHKYVELLIPFLASMLWWMLPTLSVGKVPDQWSHIIFLFFSVGTDPALLVQNYVGMVLSVVLPCIACMAMVIFERRRDAI